MSRKPKHVCFYSKKCPHSKSFLEELSRTPYTSEFQFVCVDSCGNCENCRSKRQGCLNKAKLPKWLTAVPTLVIDGEQDPLTDEKVFNWLSVRRIQGNVPPVTAQQYREPPKQDLSSRKESVGPSTYDPTPPRNDTMPEPLQTRSSPNQASNRVEPVSSTEEPLAYHMAEMASGTKWSDAYSYIDDQFSIEKGTGVNRIERSFAVLDGMGSLSLGGQQVAVTQTQESEKAKALNSAFDNFRKQRDSDLPGPVARR